MQNTRKTGRVWRPQDIGRHQWRGNYFQAGGGGQLTFTSVVHDRKKPRVPQI